MLLLAGCGVACSLLAAPDVTLSGKDTEVVIPAAASKPLRFAAQEMTNFLSRVFGRRIDLVRCPTEKRTHIFLGNSTWNISAGVTTNGLVRDSFRIHIKDETVRIVGIDSMEGAYYERADGRLDPAAYSSSGERATAFGVYEFLERFAGVRLFFPGELGEVVPRSDVLTLPETNLVVAPLFTVRDVNMYADGAWYDEKDKGLSRELPKMLSWARLRLQTTKVPCCHGQCRLRCLERFGEDHPEYFALTKGPDGRLHRDCEAIMRPLYSDNRFYLCQSSKVWDEMYEDAYAYFSGKRPEDRGIPPDSSGKCEWPKNLSSGGFVDVMCEDGFKACHCVDCQAAYDKNAANGQYATELVWNQTVRLANRLKAAGVRASVTQMAYGPYGNVPQVSIPDNVLVMVARLGPWAEANGAQRLDDAVIRSWYEKCGRKVWLWNYILKWNGGFGIPGAPPLSPRAIGRYYQRLSPYIFGAFAESGCEKAIYQYLNYYVFAKVAWNPSIDVDALVDEHHRLMFGAAAPEMKRVFDALERSWVNDIGGAKMIVSDEGPKVIQPSDATLWGKIYPVEVVSRYRAWMEQALNKVPAGSLEAKRIRFFAKEFLVPLYKEAMSMDISVEKELERRRDRPSRTLLVNGDFGSLDGWSASADGVSLDKGMFISPPSSLKVVSTNFVSVVQDITGKMTPGKRYRVSYFIKGENVQACGTYPGVWAEFLCGYSDQFFPKGCSEYGSSDWIHRAAEFTYKPRPKKPGDGETFRFFISNSKGTLWFDDLRVEEIIEAR